MKTVELENETTKKATFFTEAHQKTSEKEWSINSINTSAISWDKEVKNQKINASDW